MNPLERLKLAALLPVVWVADWAANLFGASIWEDGDED